MVGNNIYEYFISSKWRNKEQALELTEKLRVKGKTVYCFAENKNEYFIMQGDPQEAMERYESLPNWTKDSAVKEMFTMDMEGLKNSEALVLLLPAGKSCHLETGIAYGLGKKCILVGEPEKPESLYLIFSEMYPTVDKFLESL